MKKQSEIKSNANEANFNGSNSGWNKSWSDKKNAGFNDWTSVPVTYDKEESTRKNEKTETNNQWCSTSK